MSSFAAFIQERRYLKNVSPSTVSWYTHAFKWLPSESPTQEQLKDAVMRMREKGLKATGCNAVVRAINAYLHWNSGAERKCGPGCQHFHIQQLKEPQFVLPTFTPAQVTSLVSWKPKPKHFYQRRLHLLTLFLLDTGCRITEALTLRVREVDMDNMLITLDGKGRKQRVVPFSFMLRKALYRFMSDFNRKVDSLLFATRDETPVGRMTSLRGVKILCDQLGFKAPPRTLHAFRHTFAVNYLRRGGSVFHLQKVLGHTSLEMTRRYVSLVTTDLQAVHERVSFYRVPVRSSGFDRCGLGARSRLTGVRPGGVPKDFFLRPSYSEAGTPLYIGYILKSRGQVQTRDSNPHDLRVRQSPCSRFYTAQAKQKGFEVMRSPKPTATTFEITLPRSEHTAQWPDSNPLSRP